MFTHSTMKCLLNNTLISNLTWSRDNIIKGVENKYIDFGIRNDYVKKKKKQFHCSTVYNSQVMEAT